MMTLHTTGLGSEAHPGQFLYIRVYSKSTRPLLRRAFAVYKVLDKDTVAILYRVVGEGTTILSHKTSGQYVNTLAPMGHGFTIPSDDVRVIIVGEGIGVVPLSFLNSRLYQKDTKVILGFKTQGDIIGVEGFTNPKVIVGKGLIEAVTKILTPYTKVFASGSTQFLYTLSGICEARGADCEVFISSPMACGYGVCQGCVIGDKYVCVDGPVFNLSELKT